MTNTNSHRHTKLEEREVLGVRQNRESEKTNDTKDIYDCKPSEDTQRN